MDILRIVLASLGAFVAYFVFGGAVFVLMPSLKTEFAKYPAVYRDSQGQVKHMPIGMAFLLIAIAVLTVLYAQSYTQPLGLAAGAMAGVKFGVLIGIFVIGAFVVHNFANLQIGVKLAVQQSIAYFAEWLIVGVVIALIYRPAHS